MFLQKLLTSSQASSRRIVFAVPSQIHRSLFIETSTTPNPESIKFLPGRTVYSTSQDIPSSTSESSPNTSDEDQNNDATRGYYATRTDKSEISRSPLMQRLFKIDGIKSIYLGQDFITVTKFAEANWSHVRTPVFGAIMDHYASGSPAVSETPQISDTTILESDSEVVAMIKEILETRIRPAVQEDGGDIRYVGFDETSGIVSVKLAGSCVGCPSSSVTLKNGVENMLIHYIPEVLAVHSVEEDNEGDATCHTVEAPSDTMKTYEQKLAAAGIPFSD